MSNSVSRILLLFVVTLALAIQDAIGAKLAERSTSRRENYYDVQSGQISSPNFPSPYIADDDDSWTITGQLDQRIKLDFEAFMLENSSDCSKDFVQVLGGIEGDDLTDHKYCGNMDPFSVTSTSNILLVLFHSDSGRNEYPGFQATFHLVAPSDNGTETSIEQKADKCECGMAGDRQRRIVGGQLSSANKYPWLVVLVRKQNPQRAHCGAVLICPKYLLTAAHCTYLKQADYYDAVLGAYDLTKKSSSQVVVGVKRLIPHEDYFKPTENNDIALVELEKEIVYNSGIKPICMPPLGKDFTDEKGTVAGWGRTSYGGALSSILREVTMPIVDNKECQRSFSKANANITENMMCAGVLDGSIDACQGDSGGPLMWVDPSDRRTKSIGIVSFGVRCATKDYYGAYTRVNKYKEWILSKTAKECPCLFK